MDISNHHSSHYLLHEMKHTNDILNDVLAHLDKSKLEQFIRVYADGNEAFRTAFLEQCGPKPTKGSARHKPADDYVGIIKRAFADTGIKRRGRYWHDYDDEGDVQAVYDESIYLLEGMLIEGLSNELTEKLFCWYENVASEGMHQSIEYNSSLKVLEDYFVTDAVNGLDRVLRLIDQRIAHAGAWERGRVILDKIVLLEEHDRLAEADETIGRYLEYPDVRSVKYVHLKDEKRYEEAIKLLEEGIDLALEKGEKVTANDFRKELLSVYKVLKNNDKLLEINKLLFLEGVDQRVGNERNRKQSNESVS